MSLAYSSIVRSLEKKPMRATFKIASRSQANRTVNVPRRDDLLRQTHAIIRDEHDLETVAHPRVAIHDLAHAVDELDDLLGRPVARRRLAGEDVRLRVWQLLAVLDQPQVLVDDLQD